MSNTPPDVPITPAPRSFWQRASVVWIIPILALLIALGVAWQSFSERGPIVRISFSTAEGVMAGQTELKYRDVTVGVVEKVGFSDDLAKVIVDVRIDKDVAPFVDTTSTFWIVRPEVSARGITGLGTVLSGVFIEGNWDSNPDGVEYEFLGLDSAPLIRS
jgi:paraquat-inducible protein B